MLKHNARSLAVVAITVLILFSQTVVKGGPRKLRPVKEADVKKLTDAAPKKATAKPLKVRKLLVFYLCQGYYHGSIPVGVKCIEIMGRKTGAYETTISQDMSIFAVDKLKNFDAILFMNTTRLKFADEGPRKALLDFVKSGKGVAGMHAASDNFYDCPEAAGMIGGQFAGHPWGAGGTWAVKLDEPDHPLNKAFAGKGFKIKDEIYKFKNKYFSRDKVRVALSLDMSDPNTVKRVKGDAKFDNPIAWIRTFEKGRVFYCSLGHNASVYMRPDIMQHYLDGIQYALGDLKMDAKPVGKLADSRPGSTFFASLLTTTATGAPKKKRKAPVKEAVDIDKVEGTEFMGDYAGTRTLADGKKTPAVAQVLALGNGEHSVTILPEFDKRVKPFGVLKGKVEGGKLAVAAGEKKGVIADGKLTGGCSKSKFEMKKVVRLSPTMGAKPPTGAMVLLSKDTKDLNDEWKSSKGKNFSWFLKKGGVMQCRARTGGAVTKKTFASAKIHLEFRTPFLPRHRGQGRGNSGMYVHGRYEVQILDSYTLYGRDNECGGIYKKGTPLVNMCAPPLQWQTYDATIIAPKMNGNKVVEPGTLTVIHNGVLIQDKIKLPGPTGGAYAKGMSDKGGIYIQDHGHPVEFRNIWVKELK
ncbi:MAG: ThuA domain-containing protein [Phycisphaerae bacterium]|jgi:hypothetical protein|nr:ThuA domain-containing protein [Phycisphaerae bacterium]